MSIANQLKTHVFDPTIFNQRRCEFRIPKGVYLSNLRLGNIGCTVDNARSQARVKYPWHLGSYSLIQKISLLNGNIEIAELNYAGDYLAFANQNRTNANAYNVARSLNRSNWGFTVGDVEDVDAAKLSQRNSDRITVKTVLNDLSQIEPDSADTPKGWLDLSLALPFLKATPHLNCNEMQDLRLVIEWVVIPDQTQASFDATDAEREAADKAFNKYLVGKSTYKAGTAQVADTVNGTPAKGTKEVTLTTGADTIRVGDGVSGNNIAEGSVIVARTAKTITLDKSLEGALTDEQAITFDTFVAAAKVLTNFRIVQPTLMADEIVDEGALKKVKNVPITYVNLDHEVLNLPAITAQKQTQQRLRGFSDKMVRRMLIVNKYHEDRVHNMLGSFQSPALTGETQQFMVNGSKLLPYKGITNPNENLAMLNDTWGSRCQPQASHLPNFTASNSFFTPWSEVDKFAARTNYGTQLCGKLSYSGLNINQRVEELIYEHSRDVRQITKITNPILTAAATTESDDGVAGLVKFTTQYAFDVLDGSEITIKGTGDEDLNTDYGAVKGVRKASERNETGKYRSIFGNGFIINVTATEPVVTSATVEAKVPANYQSIANSKAAIDKIFWGECVKTLKVSNNVVSINY